MLKCLQRVNWKKVGLFAAGFAFGTAGVKILSSKDAKKVYTNCTAAVLRAKDSVMKTVNTVQENAGDILADAKAINEERAAKEAEEFEDVKEDAEEAEEYAAVLTGTKQYVMLGAGLDTFAFREKEFLSKHRVFEVDHPLTQKDKIERITRAGCTIPDNLTFVPADFTKDNVAERLIDGG